MPRARAIWQILFTGKIWPVRLVMWQMWITLVCGVMFSSIRFARKSRLGGGTGKVICFSSMPSRRSRCFQVVIMRR